MYVESWEWWDVLLGAGRVWVVREFQEVVACMAWRLALNKLQKRYFCRKAMPYKQIFC